MSYPTPGPGDPGSPDQPHPVMVYTAPGCGFCTLVKAFLASLGVSFNEIDISLNPVQAQELLTRTGQTGLPVTVFGGRDFVVGFNRSQLESYLRNYQLI